MHNHREIIGYQLFWNISYSTLSEEVNKWIEKGWQPLGPCIFKSHPIEDDSIYVQTMVLYKKED
jgi:hypothetical protein